jgi:hypothetical protein
MAQAMPGFVKNLLVPFVWRRKWKPMAPFLPFSPLWGEEGVRWCRAARGRATRPPYCSQGATRTEYSAADWIVL